MSSKRKAGSSAFGAGTPDAKRRKVPPVIETPEGVTEAGLGLVNHLREARDKRNRLISTQFQTLPDKEQIPEYYEATPLPLALDIIEGKLRRNEYPTLTTLESDLKRMVSNAKHFNERTSEIHSDAEKIRKMVSHHMTKMNPAYQDPDYIPFPTPIPEAAQPSLDGEASTEEGKEKARPKMILHGPSAPRDQTRQRASSTPAIPGATDAGESFEGNTFQQAQEKVVTEMMDLTDEEGSLIATPFINLPPRDLRDYYQVVKNPVSLKGIQKQVRGIKGREKPTGISFFKSWQMFEDEMGLIWGNARLYNEDGSEISALAWELENYFKKRIAEAKQAVQEPAQPRVTLRMPVKDSESITRLKLHLNPKQTHDQANGFAIDPESLQRQKDMVQAGVNGHIEPSGLGVDAGSTTKSSPPANVIQNLSSQLSALATSPPITTNGSKSESQSLMSPAPVPTSTGPFGTESRENSSSAQIPGTTGMPPPTSTTPQIASTSPHPQTTHVTGAPSAPPPVNPLESKWRQPGRGVEDALITNVVLRTHHGLPVSKHFRFSFPPSPTMTQRGISINLPATHYYLLVSPAFVEQDSTRQVRTFVLLNGRQQSPTPTERIEDADPTRPVYALDLRPVTPGVNRIDIECIAGLPRGAPKVGTGPDFEFEKTTIYVCFSNCA